MKRLAPALLLALLVGCNPPFRPAVEPQAEGDGVRVRVEGIELGVVQPPPRPLGATSGLVVQVHAEPGTRLEKALLTRTTRAPCTGGSPVLSATADGAAVKLPVAIEGEHDLVLGFFPTPEESLEGPTALDLVLDAGGRRACLRTPLGEAQQWDRPQWAFDFGVSGGAPLQTLGDLGSAWTLDERLGVLVGNVELGAGLRAGIGSCGECFENTAILDGPAVAATYYPLTSGRAALALELSYAALFEQIHLPADPTGSDPRLREWFQVPGVALQWDFLGPPRGSRVRLRGRDFNSWGFALFDQLWIPTLHADRPATVLGAGLVGRLAF